MQGKPEVPFSELFADTVQTHGIKWAHNYYRNHGVSLGEFSIWLAGLLNA